MVRNGERYKLSDGLPLLSHRLNPNPRAQVWVLTIYW